MFSTPSKILNGSEDIYNFFELNTQLVSFTTFERIIHNIIHAIVVEITKNCIKLLIYSTANVYIFNIVQLSFEVI